MERFSAIDISPSVSRPQVITEPEKQRPRTTPIKSESDRSSSAAIIIKNRDGREASDSQVQSLFALFDRVVAKHQEHEDARNQLDLIDEILFTSRSVGVLVENLTEHLIDALSLDSAAILIRDDHPIAVHYQEMIPTGMGFVPHSIVESLGFDIQFLNDLSGFDVEAFAANAPKAASAIVTPLHYDQKIVGLLCLGSSAKKNPHFKSDIPLIYKLAKKIITGLLNAWAHENQARAALMSTVENVYTEGFFMEFMRKHFNAAWRKQSIFSVIAVSWSPAETQLNDEVSRFIVGNVRSSDLCARGEIIPVWLLLPDTDGHGANVVAQRLSKLIEKEFPGHLDVNFGLSEFSRSHFGFSTILNEAKMALEKACDSSQSNIMMEP